ncbi:MAG: hypothetical protein LUC43_05925 [Burkholderiales bacterium]|nr:hypothetical protein [Burkholderiales bacterium]
MKLKSFSGLGGLKAKLEKEAEERARQEAIRQEEERKRKEEERYRKEE